MTDKDPSMTEILASIRRIISEDDGDFAAPPPERPDPAWKPSQERSQAAPDATAAAPDRDAVPPPPPSPSPPPPPPPDETELQQDDNAQQQPPSPLLSTQTQDETGRAFDQLRKNVAVPQGRSVALDTLVRELLHPLLRQWLDANLPQLVESLVREEIRRIARKQDE